MDNLQTKFISWQEVKNTFLRVRKSAFLKKLKIGHYMLYIGLFALFGWVATNI